MAGSEKKADLDSLQRYLVRDDNMKPLYMIGCVNEIGKRQKADNVSGLLGESGFREYMNQLDTPLETGYLLRIGIDILRKSMITSDRSTVTLYLRKRRSVFQAVHQKDRRCTSLCR